MRPPKKRLGKQWNTQSKPRKRKMSATKKYPFNCIGGMFDGQKIWLTDGYSMIFSASGIKGRYVPTNKQNPTSTLTVRFEQC